MTDNTNTTTVDPEVPIDKQGPFGDGTVRVEIDEETYNRLREAYEVAVEQGHPEHFDVFAINMLSRNYLVTVDGEVVYDSESDNSELPSDADAVTLPDLTDE